MSVKERIMTIRLCEKMAKHPQFAKSLGIEHVDFQRYSSYKLRTYGGCDILHFLDETGKKQSQTLMGDSKPHHFNTDVVVVKYPGYKPGTWKYKAYPAEMFENRTSMPFE